MTASLRGLPIDLRMKIAFVETPSIQLEFIQPLEPNNIYTEFLEQHGEGLHHVMFDTQDPEGIASRLNADVLQSGDTVKARRALVLPRHACHARLSTGVAAARTRVSTLGLSHPSQSHS